MPFKNRPTTFPVAVRMQGLSDGRDTVKAGKNCLRLDLRALMGRGTSLVYQAEDEGLDPERKENVVQVELDGNGSELPKPVERKI